MFLSARVYAFMRIYTNEKIGEEHNSLLQNILIDIFILFPFVDLKYYRLFLSVEHCQHYL